MRRWARIAGSAALMLAAALVILAILEGVLRVLGFGPEVAAELRPDYEKFEPDEELIWSLKPNWRGRELNEARVSTNSLGLRGAEPSPDAPSRILFLGDSVVFGHHLGDDQTLPARLEERLRRDHVEVVNGGVPGFSTFQEAALYRSRGRALRPDLVLLGFCLNDVTERYVTVAEYGGPRYFMKNVDTRRSTGGWLDAWRSSAIRGVFTRSARAYQKRLEIYNVGSLWQKSGAPEIRSAWTLVFDELDLLIASVAEDGARFGVILFPYRLQLGKPSVSLPQRELLEFFEKRGVPTLDLLPLLEAQDDPARLFLDANHLSALGSRRVADWIAGFVRDRELLPAQGGPTRR